MHIWRFLCRIQCDINIHRQLMADVLTGCTDQRYVITITDFLVIWLEILTGFITNGNEVL